MTKARDDLSVEYVRKRLDYNPDTGELLWRPIEATTRHHRRWNTMFAGKPAGCYTGRYLVVRVDGRLYTGHRLMWAIMTGSYPERLVDHIDGDRYDNRWASIRAATDAQNVANAKIYKSNTSKCKGVTHDKKTGMYTVRISANRVRHLLLYTKDYAEAVAARRAGEQKYHGEFARAS